MIPQRVEVNPSKNQLNNYHILDVLHAGAKSLVYRAQCTSDNQPIILKLLRNEYPNFNELIQFRNQYTITKNLNLSGVVQPLALENYRNSLLLVMPDTGCIALSDYIKTHTLSLAQFLKIAIALATTLEELYHHRIIHKDIKPANILIHPQTLDVKLIDFSIASLLPKETQEIKNPNILEGTLSYISPEQTGRMNRGIDYRTDFYSLGVTFYELLTGRLPFDSTDAMELVHCHLAKPIPALQEFSRELLPDMIPEIVNKLMAKNAENRYQSAWGLKFDLEQCLFQLQETGKIQRFEIGTHDISDYFMIPEKLYGRQAQVQELLNAFNRVACPKNHKRCSEIILMSGYSGVGKTAVVNEIQKPIVKQRSYFIKGKFDQFQRNIPLSAFLQALRNLIGQLLSESDTQLQKWKEQILNAVGENGQVIIEVIPELETIIGQQPPVAELSGTAAQNRFNLLFQKFIQVFTRKKHSLVIFLDDLQWADLTSLKLIKLLMSETESQYLLLIGAYRDNEVNPAHPLMLTLDNLYKNEAIIRTIPLAPLQQKHLNQLVAETLHCSLKQAFPLSQAVYQKTKGNPFFVTQFLKALYEDNLIHFNREEGCWQCDLAQVKLAAVSEDVVEFVGKRLQKLNSVTQNALKLAACIGNQFDLETLAIVRQTSEVETATDLWVALQEGLILSTTEIYKFYRADNIELHQTPTQNHLSASYKFLHDRIQQAAYSLIPEDNKQATHYQIGQLLLQKISLEAQEDRIFELINQLNYGTALITDQKERDQLAQLNLTACRKARNSTAYKAGREYVNIALSLLGQKAWQRQYEISLALHNLAAEFAALSGDFEAMNALIETVIAQAHTLLEQVDVYRIRIQFNVSQNQSIKAIEIAQSILKKLNITLNESPTQTDIHQAIQEIEQLLSNREILDFVHLPMMTDSEKIAIVQIASSVIPAAIISGSPLFPLLVSLSVKLSLQYGNTSVSAFAYAVYGLMLCNILQDIETATQWGQLAFQVISKLETKVNKPEVLDVLAGFIFHRKSHLKETLPLLQEGYSTALEVGNLEFAGYTAQKFCLHSFLCGQPLAILETETRAYCNGLEQLNQWTTANWCRIYWQSILNLLEVVEHPNILSGKALQEEKFLEQLLCAEDLLGLYLFYLYKLMLSYLFGEIELANSYTLEIRNYLISGAGFVSEPTFYFYDSLIALAALGSQPNHTSDFLQRVEQNQTQLKQHWAKYAPMNHQHKVDLVEAEKHRILGEKLEAIELYDQAIAAAKKNEYLQEEALANERAAKFYLDWHKTKIAQTYMIEAYYCYSHWGAKAKVQDLEKHYSELLSPILLEKSLGFNPLPKNRYLSEQNPTKSTRVSSKNLSESLDFTSIIKASQALSSEMELGKLMAHLMQVTLETAGASGGSLILLEDGMLVIQAQSKGANNCYLESFPVQSSDDIPKTLINYVYHKQEILVINDLQAEIAFANDSYLNRYQPQSILCLPLLNKCQFIGILYLENNLITGAFTQEQIEVLKLLCAQAAISLENAELYQKSTNYSHKLERYLQDLKAAQLQLIQSEKMSALGQMMAGIAHEINNPVGFIAGNLSPAEEYLQDLIEHLNLYQEELSSPSKKITDHAEDIELDYLLEDLPELISSMKTGVNRIRNISSSMRTFSRSDTAQKVIFDIHEGLDSTLLILKHRLKANEHRPEIVVIKNQSHLPPIHCYPGQLNQVFMNILANAIDAFDEMSQSPCCCQNSSLNTQAALSESSESHSYKIWIETEFITETKAVEIRIQDNGMGIPKEVQDKIFDHLFTTKPVGKGTGLGLSISRQIIEEKHGGKLDCISTPGQGTKFVIQIPEE